MYHFIIHIFKIAIRCQIDYSQCVQKELNPEDIIYHFSDKILSEEIHRVAKEKRGDIIGMYNLQRYVNLKVDSGTILQSKVLQMLLDSKTFSGKTPIRRQNIAHLVLPVRNSQRFYAEDYEAYFIEMFSYILKRIPNAIICSISHDNLPAQVKGLRNALQREEFQGIIDIPCMNHMINLIFTNSISNSELFSNVIKEIINWKNLLKDEIFKEHIGKIPNIPLKRWMYIVDIQRFIDKNINVIDFILSSNPNLMIPEHIIEDEKVSRFPRSILEIKKILEPLRYLSDTFEKSDFPLCNVIPNIQKMFKKYQEYFRDLNNGRFSEKQKEKLNSILDILITIFLKRLLLNSYNEICTAYALTKDGREKLRFLQQGNMTQGFPSFSDEKKQYLNQEPKINMTSLYNKHVLKVLHSREVPINRSESPRLDVKENNIDEFDEECDDDFFLLQIENAQNCEEDCVFDVDLQIPLEVKLQHDFMKDVEKNSKKEFIRRAKIIHKELDESVLSLQWDAWIYGLISELPFVSSLMNAFGTPYYVWSCAMMHDEWKNFGDVAKRFILSAISEADVERIFSVQRSIQQGTMTNISTGLIRDRLTLQAAK